MIICDCHGAFQLPVTLLDGLNLVDQIGPDIVQHLDRIVGLRCVNVELPQESGQQPHSPDQTLTLARSALVIQIKRLANAVAKRMAWVL